MKKILLWSYVLLMMSCTTSSSPKNQLNLLIERYQNYSEERTEKTPLGDYRELRFEKYATFCDSLQTELEAISLAGLDENDQLSYELLRFKLHETAVQYKFKTHWNPILSDAGFHSSLTYRVRPITSKKAALDYLNLLKAIPTFIEQQTELITKGLDAGIGQPLIIFDGYA